MIGLKITGIRETVQKFERLEQDLQALHLRAMKAATVRTRNALFSAMSGVVVSVPFWGAKSPEGHILAARSGHTRAALSPGQVWQAGEHTFGVVGHSEPHVAALEVGATIRPTSGQFLRIPTANVLTGAGVDRYTGMSIRQIPGARLIRTKTGRLWAIRPVGSGRTARIEFLYLLVRSVKLPEKRIFATVTVRMNAELPATFQAEVMTATQRAA